MTQNDCLRSQRELQKVLTKIGDGVCEEEKIKRISKYYLQDPLLSSLRHNWKMKKYTEGFKQIELFLKVNENILDIKYMPIGERQYLQIVDTRKGYSNNATIKTIGQLSFILKGKKNISLLHQLLSVYKKTKKAFLFLNPVVTDKEKCREVFHEVNAWLMSGCARSKKTVCFFGDWRTLLPYSHPHKKLDKIFFFS